jgi:hypothetical protein
LINLKGQTTPGLLLGVGTIMFLFLLIAVFTVNQQIKLTEKEDYIEKRSECLKLANLINSAYISGPGTEIITYTDYLITTFNNSQISVQGISELNTSGELPRIAFLASEAGPTLREFYDQVNENMDVDWYKICFDDLSGSGCGWSGTNWMDTEIQYTLHDLMDNLDNYNTVYLEDPTMNYEHYSSEYITLLEDWVSEGNALILSEHVFCSESSGSHSYNSYRCNGPGGNDNDWELFGVSLHQRFGAWGWDNRENVVVNDTGQAFDLIIGDQLSFEERPYVNNINATNFKTIAKYTNTQCGWWWTYDCLRDSADQPAIAFWDYGEGKVFYFGDFLVEYINTPSKSFSDVLTDLISIAYYLIASPEEDSEVVCHFSAFAAYQVVTGDIKIRNVDNFIILENVNQTS